MREALVATALAAMAAFIVTGWANAQSPRDCGSLWKEADTDSNGALELKEDERGYFDAYRINKTQTLKPDVISRDEFMLYCDGSLERSSTGARQHKGNAGPIDRGKGDMTPGLIPFPKNEARKRLEAMGFRDAEDLVLDQTGIWRTTAIVGGKRVPVAVDVQGEIIAGG
jgi:hypothetical protein